MANIVNTSLFYSDVNLAVQREILARSAAGFGQRTNKQLDFMLSKVANVSIQAYEKSVPTEDSIIPESILGGAGVRGGSFVPNGPEGFLKNPVYRTKPYLQDVNISVKDQSRGYLNKAMVSIIIPDPTTDMDKMENIFCRPGRTATIFIEYPSSAILTEDKIAEDQHTNYKILKQLYPVLSESNFNKLSSTTFTGKITNFSYSYEKDASVKISVELLGTTGTYINVSTYVADVSSNKTTDKKSVPTAEQNAVNSFYNQIVQDIRFIEQNFKKFPGGYTINEHSYEIILDPTGRGILNGTLYTTNGNQNNKTSEDPFISIGQLVYYINTMLLSKVSNDLGAIPEIICNDQLCQSNYFENLVSANPKRVLLWPGTGDAKCNVYSSKFKAYDSVLKKGPGFMRGTEEGPKAFPAWIYVNLSVIREIINQKTKPDETVTIKNLINSISEEISKLTGQAITLKLIQHPDPNAADALLLYDSSYVGDDTVQTTFEIPVYSESLSTAVLDMSITSKIPESIKTMIYGLSAGKSTTQQTAMYSEYVYATAEVRETIKSQHKQKYLDALDSFNAAKSGYALTPDSDEKIGILINALEKHITYHTEDIEKGIRRLRPVFPMEVTITLNGINGFKWGDVLNIGGIPKKYRDSFVFMVIGVSHSVTVDGDWTTELTLMARVKLV